MSAGSRRVVVTDGLGSESPAIHPLEIRRVLAPIAQVAQLVEHAGSCTCGVGGSIPPLGTISPPPDSLGKSVSLANVVSGSVGESPAIHPLEIRRVLAPIAQVAQLVEHAGSCACGVGGSIPPLGTISLPPDSLGKSVSLTNVVSGSGGESPAIHPLEIRAA